MSLQIHLERDLLVASNDHQRLEFQQLVIHYIEKVVLFPNCRIKASTVAHPPIPTRF